MTTSEGKIRLATWFRQWRGPLRRFLVGRGALPSLDLDDVAQEVFLRLMRYDRAELIENPQVYLYKMANNVALDAALKEFAQQTGLGGSALVATMNRISRRSL